MIDIYMIDIETQSNNCRVGIKGLWLVNYWSISWSHKPKTHNMSIFYESFCPKYDNFKIIKLYKWMSLINQRKKVP